MYDSKDFVNTIHTLERKLANGAGIPTAYPSICVSLLQACVMHPEWAAAWYLQLEEDRKGVADFITRLLPISAVIDE